MLEGGRSSIGIESTIIDLTKKPKILRLGGLKINKINRVLKKNIIKDINSSKIYAPVQFKLHYSPSLPIRLNAKKAKDNEAYIILKKTKTIKSNYYFLSKDGSLKEAAKNLYSTLRKIKNSKFKSIAIKSIPNEGLGETINDRLLRASKY